MPPVHYDSDGYRIISNDDSAIRHAVPEHGWANPQDLDQNVGIFNRMIDSAERIINIAGTVGHMAAHRALDGLDYVAEKFGREK